MRFRFSHAAVGLVIAGLIALPACDKKNKSTTPDTPPPPVGGPGVPIPNPGHPNTSQPTDPTLPMPPSQRPVLGTSDAANRQRSQNNLKQIALAFFNFESTYGGFPSGVADKNGKIGLSWRVAILPYIEQDNLYRQFKLDEPWDSEHNKKLISMMPTTYAPPRVSTNGYTYYRSFSGVDTVMPPVRTGAPGQAVTGIKLTGITDGTSFTFLVAEAQDPVIWTKPDDLPYEKGKPVPKLGGGVFGDGFNVAYCDGSARFIKNGLSETLLGNLINPHDGNPIPPID
jgi:prepilin-type processing-associated H-X9-DG protein